MYKSGTTLVEILLDKKSGPLGTVTDYAVKKIPKERWYSLAYTVLDSARYVVSLIM